MIESFVYKTLKEDALLRSLLGGSEEEPRIDPRTTTHDDCAVVYKIVPVSFDGFIHTDRIEIRIIDDNDDAIRSIQDRITALLLIREGDPPRRISGSDGTKIVFSCKVNGGGDLDDYTVKQIPNVHRLLYFNTIWRLIA